MITLSAHSPKLDPVEKFWYIVKDTICNKACPTPDALEVKLTETLRKYWEVTSRVLSLFTNSYLRFELNDSDKIHTNFIKLNGITRPLLAPRSRVMRTFFLGI